MQLNETLLPKLRNIKMVLLDVDGVMTNGQVMLLPDGEELKFFSIHDGFGIVCAMKSGIRIGIISGRSSKALQMRCEELNIEDLYMNTMEKLPALERISAERKIPFEQIAFLGDDVPDLPVLERVGFSAAPQNAHTTVKDRVDLVLTKNGGDGAVREFLDLLLETQGKLDPIIKKYSSR